MPSIIRLTTASMLLLATATASVACNIPVFRYALERWRADQCEVIVFHDAPLSNADQNLIAAVNPDGSEDSKANVKVFTSDLNSKSAEHRDLWEQVSSQSNVTLPYVVVRTQVGPRLINGWHGPLDSAELSYVIDSPVRRELGRRLLAGHSIVWLMIRSADKQQNAAARRMMETNLDSLADKIELPDGIGLPGSELHSELPLLVQFSLLEIDRDDPKEDFLVSLLSGFQPEALAAGDPLLIPVFGRGRALEVIPASRLNERLLEDLTVFLSGACSCQVKDQNPGFDLLLAIDWNTELFGEGAQQPAERTTRDRQQPILLTIPPGRN